ncbi:hypothetical protein BD779DRAFT_1475401 [Infundibulicybe gibba]|nr:hypothetical protein BD779DRAFT_1475401 [Infundibulicybe gibba]
MSSLSRAPHAHLCLVSLPACRPAASLWQTRAGDIGIVLDVRHAHAGAGRHPCKQEVHSVAASVDARNDCARRNWGLWVESVSDCGVSAWHALVSAADTAVVLSAIVRIYYPHIINFILWLSWGYIYIGHYEAKLAMTMNCLIESTGAISAKAYDVKRLERLAFNEEDTLSTDRDCRDTRENSSGQVRTNGFLHRTNYAGSRFFHTLGRPGLWNDERVKQYETKLCVKSKVKNKEKNKTPVSPGVGEGDGID